MRCWRDGYINQQDLARKHPLNSEAKVLRSRSTCSSLTSGIFETDLLDAIDYLHQQKLVRGNFQERSFGGVPGLFIEGDLYRIATGGADFCGETLRRYYPTVVL